MSEREPGLDKTEPQTVAKEKDPSASARFDPLVGTSLADRYEIIRRIGEGGMGAVYEARHSIIGKRVAIKVLLEKFLENEELIARLLQEARLASSIGHQNIVDVTDFGTTRDGRAFVVMEFLEGEPLSELILRDAPLPVERSLVIVKQVASALGAAHAKGIVHRDVKPENVYLVRRGDQDFVKVVDFGVSKAVRTLEETDSNWQRLTRTGTVLGTPLFMSPEQASGREDIDERADIWATALLLYECLTGELPFQGSNYLGVIAQILSKETQPPSTLRPELGIPLGADRIVLRGLEKDREKRYQRMADFERAMDRLLAGEMDVGLDDGPSENAPSPRPTRRRWPWPVPLAAILALGAGSAALLARTEKEKPRESPPALRVVSAPAMSNPLPLASAAPAAKTETTAPNEPMRPTANDRIRHPSKSHAPRPPTPLEDTSPKVPKSKADDRVAPSPYGDREGR